MARNRGYKPEVSFEVWGRESADVFSSLVSAAEEPKFRNRSSPWQRAAARVRRERERVESRPRSVSPGGIVANGVENSVEGVNQD